MCISGAGRQLNNLFQQQKQGGYTNNDFKQLVATAKQDGKIDVDEAKVLIDAAHADDGSVSGSDEISAMVDIGKSLNRDEYQQLRGKSDRLRSAEQNPVQGNISFLINEGMRSKTVGRNTEANVISQERSSEGTMRSASRTLSNAPFGIGTAWKAMPGNGDITASGDLTSQVQRAQTSRKAVEGRVDNVASTRYQERTEAGRSDCVENTLKRMQPAGQSWDLSGMSNGVNVSTNDLKTRTKTTWGQTSINNLNHTMNNKTLIVDASHSYQLNSIDRKAGVLNVTSPSGQKTTLSINNPALRAFVMGAAQTSTTASKEDRVVHSSRQLKNDPSRAINALDKTNGQNNAGWETRKILTAMADPSMKGKFQEFKGLAQNVANGGDTAQMAVFLKGIGIDTTKFDRDKMVTMAKAMMAPIPGGKLEFTPPGSTVKQTVKAGNMMEAFEWLNSRGNGTQNQVNVMKGLEYTNINLSTYFNANNGIAAKASDMKHNLELLLCGKDGC